MSTKRKYYLNYDFMSRLTEDEIKLLKVVATTDKSYKELCAELGITYGSLNMNMQRLAFKLSCHGRHGLLIKGIKYGYIKIKEL